MTDLTDTTRLGPVVTVPANATVEATAASGAMFSYTATATDVLDGGRGRVSCTPRAGDVPVRRLAGRVGRGRVAAGRGGRLIARPERGAFPFGRRGDLRGEVHEHGGRGRAARSTRRRLGAGPRPCRARGPAPVTPASGSTFALGATITVTVRDTTGR